VKNKNIHEMMRSAQSLIAYNSDLVARFGITLNQYSVLKAIHLWHGSEPCRQKDISRMTGIDRSSMSVIVNRLSASRVPFIEINRQAIDRRADDLSLTQRGYEVIIEAIEYMAEQDKELCSALGADSTQFLAVLKTLDSMACASRAERMARTTEDVVEAVT